MRQIQYCLQQSLRRLDSAYRRVAIAKNHQGLEAVINGNPALYALRCFVGAGGCKRPIDPQEVVTVSPIHTNHVKSAELHDSSRGLKRPAWVRSVEVFALVGEGILKRWAPEKQPWSSDYSQYLQVKSQLLEGASLASNRRTESAR